MKLCKATIYYYDSNNDMATNDLKYILEENRYIQCKIFDEDIQEVEIGEWYDEIPINYTNATKKDYEKYFMEEIK